MRKLPDMQYEISYDMCDKIILVFDTYLYEKY